MSIEWEKSTRCKKLSLRSLQLTCLFNYQILNMILPNCIYLDHIWYHTLYVYIIYTIWCRIWFVLKWNVILSYRKFSIVFHYCFSLPRKLYFSIILIMYIFSLICFYRSHFINLKSAFFNFSFLRFHYNKCFYKFKS